MAKEFGAMRVFVVVFLIINNINVFTTAENLENFQYETLTNLPQLHSPLVNLRAKRQTQLDLKNQYQSVSQNGTDAATATATESKQSPQAPSNQTPQPKGTVEQSVIVPFSNNSERPLLGVNGAGQRKDMTDTKQVKPTLLSADASDKKPTQFPKKVLLSAGAAAANGDLDKLIDEFDVPDNETIAELGKHNLTVNMVTDHHNYYNSSMYVNEAEATDIWNSFKNTTHNSMLSQSHRRAMTVELQFDFPFYGHPVRNLTVATGGFMYTGEYVHSWLAATQYIAPLMANFDTSMSNNSFVRLNDNGTAFTVIWENVPLQDRPESGTFTFSATLHQSGDIVFTYFKVPIAISSIQDDKHPVKVGLSDAYIIDKIVNFARRKTIYEYHRVNFGGVEVRNGTIVRLTALPTCLEYTDCEACINHETVFTCTWCPILNRCSSGTDRKKQEWISKGCDRTTIHRLSECPAIGARGNNATKPITPNDGSTPAPMITDKVSTTTSKSNYVPTANPHDDPAHSTQITPTQNGSPTSSEIKLAAAAHDEPKSMGLAVGVLMPICLVIMVLLWILYAYRNPHTKSGQLLIQYRPGAWSWRRGEARYTAATIHM